MKFHNAELECTFEIPEPLSYRLALRYDSEVELNLRDSAGTYERLWRGVQAVAVGWTCPHIAITGNLDDAGSYEGIEAVKWAGLMAFSYRESLKEIPLASSAPLSKSQTATDQPPPNSALPGSASDTPEASPTAEA